MLEVRGYASVFGNVDSYGEIVDNGAFGNWLAENEWSDVPIYWNHAHIWDPLAKPIGVATYLEQDDYGLFFRGKILDTPEGIEVQKLIESGAASEASFAFNVLDSYEDSDDIPHLSELSLKEISSVDWGANPLAYIEPAPQGEPTDGS